MTSEVLARLTPPPFEMLVPCGGEAHPVTVIDGVPHARAHGVEERALEVFGGTPPACMALAAAVRRAPQQLARYEHLAVERKREPRTSTFSVLVSIILRDTATHHGEAPLDPESVPTPLRRLAFLEVEREKAAASRPPEDHLSGLAQKWVACTVAQGLGLLGLSFEMGASPGVYETRKGRARARIRVAPDWFTTVYLFGLEMIDGAFTLGATLPAEPDGVVVLTQFEREGGVVPRCFERRVPARDLIPNIGFVAASEASA